MKLRRGRLMGAPRGFSIACGVGLVAALMTLALIAAPAAQAQTPFVDIHSAGPLSDIFIGNDLSCQVAHTGDSSFEFFPPAGVPADCGTFLSVTDDPNVLYGPDFSNHAGRTAYTGTDVAFTPVSQVLTGSGTATNPYQLTTVANAATTGIQIQEVDSYVVGNDYYQTDITVNNQSDVFFSGFLYHAGDCFLRGFDTGYGAADTTSPNTPAPACTINPNNSPASAIEEFVPLPNNNIFGAAHYVEAGFSTVWSDVGTQTNLPNTCDCANNEDNGEAINWEVLRLASGGSRTFSLQTKIDDPSIAATGGQSFSGTAPATVSGTVATVSDSDTGTTPDDYSATVDWGDGSAPDEGATISGGNGSFAVADSHTYTRPGSYTITVTVSYANNRANSASATDSAVVRAAPSPVVTGPPRVVGSSGAVFSGSVDPEGLPTSAHFEYGLDGRYTAGAGTVYDQSTPSLGVGSDFSAHAVSASVSGLLPNALYHVRLVAGNGAGSAIGPDRTFRTRQDPLPPAPVIGKSVNAAPVSGVVFIKPPKGKSLGKAADARAAKSTPLVKGKGFVPLTEARQIPIGSQIDARRGTLKLVTASQRRGKTQFGTFGSALFGISQIRKGLHKGLTTLSLLEGDFFGAPTYASCQAHTATDNSAPTAHAALSRRILQTLHSHVSGRFRTRGRYSAGTVRGTIWDTTDRCDGTLTVVHRGTVDVTDFQRRKTIAIHAGHSYLARAIKQRRHK